MGKTQRKKVTEEQAFENPASDFYVVGIGASAGGLDAIQRFFDYIPANTNMAFCVIQHLSPNFKSLMNELLRRHSQIQIKVAEDGEILKPNHIYLNNKDSNLIVQDGKLTYVPKSDKSILNFPIDLFFHSLANEYLNMSIGVILSGTGTDGSRGIQSIRHAGGTVMVQHPDSAQFNGMPNAALGTNHVEYVGIPEELAIEVTKFPNKVSFLSDVGQKGSKSPSEIFFSQILDQLHTFSGIDFKKYKYGTLIRRLEKRLNFTNHKQLSDYLAYLKQSQEEKEILQKDFLIGVTNFFRDKEAFEYIKTKILSQIFEKVKTNEVIRVWVAACSTGEEAYSLAILMEEYIRNHNLKCTYKIFATDIDGEAIEYASLGEYTVNIIADIQPDYLNRYFLKVGNIFRVDKSIREKIVFSKHNILRDPPFIKMDLISCRNMLIYINNQYQEKILTSFQFALNVGGILFLGNSENLGKLENQYMVLNNKWKIYKLQNKLTAHAVSYQMNERIKDLGIKKPTGNLFHQKFFETEPKEKTYINNLLTQFVPNCIYINAEYRVLYVQGDVSKYLRINSGIPNPNLLNMIDENLSAMVKNGIRRSKEEKKEIIFKDIKLKKSGEHVNIRFKTVKLSPNHDTFLIIFSEDIKPAPGAIVYDQYELDEFSKQRIEDLERELRTKEMTLHNIVEELETSNEELQTSNEELLSSNEELQSTNEELQSVNEELYTVNTEMQARNKELSDLTNDVDNLLKSTNIGTLFVDLSLTIRKFTPALKLHFNLNDGDIGRPIKAFASRFPSDKPDDLVDKITKVIETLVSHEEEIVGTEGRYFLRRITPFITSARVIDGAVITLVDISSTKNVENQLRIQKDLLSKFMDAATDSFVLWDKNLNLVDINKTGLGFFPKGVLKSSLIGKHISEIDPTAEITGRIKDYQKVIKTGQPVIKFDQVNDTFGGRHLNLRTFKVADGIGTIASDISEIVLASEKIKTNEIKYRSLFERLSSGFALHKVIYDSENQPVDYIFLEGNKKFEIYTDLKLSNIIGKRATEVFPGIANMKPNLIKIYGDVAKTGRSKKLEFKFGPLQDKWFKVTVFRPMENHFATVFEDITDKKAYADKIEDERKKLMSIFNGLESYICIADPKTYEILFANDELKKRFPKVITGRKCYEVYRNQDIPCEICNNEKIFGHNLGKVFEFEEYNKKTGKWMHRLNKAIKWGDKYVRFEMSTDITDRKVAEQSLAENENRFRSFFESTPVGMYQCDLNGSLIFGNNELQKILNIKTAEKNKTPILPFVKALKANEERWYKLEQGEVISDFEYLFNSGKNGNKNLNISVARSKDCLTGMILDNTDKKQNQVEIIKKQEILNFAEELGNLGSWEWNINDNKVYLSDNAFNILGIDPKQFDNSMKSFIQMIHPADQQMFDEIIRKLDIGNNRSFYVFSFIRPNDRIEKQISGTSFLSLDEKQKPEKVNGIIFDISEEQKTKDNLVKLNKELLHTNEKLSRTNNELRQFAYITSHDLNEPLRMITGFMGLITKNYADKLDDEGREYIKFAVDGAERMKKLIKDLLLYSRIDTRASQHIHVNLTKVLDDILRNLDIAISESGAIIKIGKLPMVNAEPSQMTQLFQNMVANAIKFKGKKSPEISISVVDKDPFWEFAIEDNGIGIKSEYFDKIFGIFERLHSREEYEGTGIGLAVCKKIVERHNGTIHVESKFGHGTTFYFTIPKKL